MGSPTFISPAARRSAAKYLGTAASGFARTFGSMAARRALRGRQTYRPRRSSNPSRVRYGLAKRFTVTSLATPTHNALTPIELSGIPRGTALNTRERDEINVRGVHLRMDVCATTDGSTEFTQFVNWAVIQLKNRTPGTALSGTEIRTDFFRSALDKRNADFGVVGSGTHKRQYAINTDKFNVFARGELQIGSNSPGMSFPSCATVSRYIPISTNVQYDDNTATSAHNPLALVYWPTDIDTFSTTTSASQVKIALSVLMSYRDVV